MSRYNFLRWKLLEYKLMYYHPDKVHKSRHSSLLIPDVEYDALEQEMLALDVQLGYNEGKIVDFPLDTPSGKLIISKLKAKKK